NASLLTGAEIPPSGRFLAALEKTARQPQAGVYRFQHVPDSNFAFAGMSPLARRQGSHQIRDQSPFPPVPSADCIRNARARYCGRRFMEKSLVEGRPRLLSTSPGCGAQIKPVVGPAFPPGLGLGIN